MKNECILCNYENIKDYILDETKNFYLIVNKYLVSPGHILVVSKHHYSCFGALPRELYKEYGSLLEKAKNKIRKSFSEPILTEQGIHGQSIKHAHTHLFPSISEIYDFSKKRFIFFIPKNIKVEEVENNLKKICKIFDEDKEYVSIEENRRLYVCRTKNYKGVLRAAREFIVKAGGPKRLLHGQTESKEEKKENQKWLDETMLKLKQ